MKWDKINFGTNKKVQNKIELQKLLKLEVNPNIPMVGIVSRLVSQKEATALQSMR